MYNKTKHVHFVGIGGIGMSGIAELLLNLGYIVSGSDLRTSAITRGLEQLGGTVYQGHRADHISGAEVVVTSSAVAHDNPEVLAALEGRIPVIQRAEMLAELMRLEKYGIAIAGSHGKTSTTSLVAAILAEAGLDPTVVVGGKVDCLGGSNARLGVGEFLVAEADESDGSFLKLSPVIEVVTNIDLEHLDYYRDLDHIKETFLQFIGKIPFYGAAVLCLDDENIAELLPQIQRRKITYGLTEQADLHAAGIIARGCSNEFTVYHQGRELGRIRRNTPGRHIVYNSLAAIAVALELEIEFSVIARALAGFEGVQRRLQVKGEEKGILVVDDYGHHPTEIRATLDAIRDGWPERRLIVAFQPHRYTRTRGLFNEFKTAFHRADVLILTDIYAASEEPIEGVHSRVLLEAIKQHGQRRAYYHADLSTLPGYLEEIIREGDLVLTLGAGNIVRVGEQLLDLLARSEQSLTEYEPKAT
jgi:UDP-N-acetylmuramate--alanine ligase